MKMTKHALERLQERAPAALHSKEMICAAIDIFLGEGFHSNVDFVCKQGLLQVIRYKSPKLEVYFLIDKTDVVTVYNRSYIKRMKKANKHKKRIGPLHLSKPQADNRKKWRARAPYRPM